jgi:hypothetical protein
VDHGAQYPASTCRVKRLCLCQLHLLVCIQRERVNTSHS